MVPAPVAALVWDELVPGLVGLALGLVGCVLFGRLVALALASRGWPTAPGQVASVVVSNAGRRNEGRRATVTYTFVVGERRYHATRVCFGDHLDLSHATAAAHRRRFAPGQAVEVRYHPRRPHEATLECRAALLAWVGLGGCVAFVTSLLVALAPLVTS